MAKFKVVTPTGPTYGAKSDYALELEALRPLGAEIVEVDAKGEDDFVAAARDADALYAKGRKITKKIVDGLSRCRVISLGSVGVDSVDVAAATARGIPVTNVPDTFIEEVADHAMMLILATFRRLTTMDRMVREGRWREGRPLLYHFPRLMGQTLGFIAYDPVVEELMMSRYGVEPVSLPELLAQADIITMHAPATPSAHHMLREEHFRAMKRTALFVNTGRGPTVDEPALIKALQEGWIAGAGLDVLEEEPVTPSNPLLKMDNVILTPHVASASARFDPVRLRRVGQEIALVLSGRWPMSCVNPAVLDKSELQRWQKDFDWENRLLHVSVFDPGGESEPQVKKPDIEVPGGVGLFLVDQLSSRWGVDRGRNGSTQVWFELPTGPDLSEELSGHRIELPPATRVAPRAVPIANVTPALN